MSRELMRLYQKIRETPALTVDFPVEVGKGRITRLDTSNFSLSSWNMEFRRETLVEGKVARDMRLLFCCGESVEWDTSRGRMRLDHGEGCFCLSDGASERMCYSGDSPFSFLSVSMPVERFAGVVGDYMPEPDRLIEQLNGRCFTISAAIQRGLHEIGPLALVHGGFEIMRLDARLLESLSLCMQAGLCEPVRKSSLHREDLTIIRAIGKRIENDPATVPDIAALAREACMSISKLTRSFRQVYGTSLHAYVMEVRLQKGAELLMNDEISIQEIAELVGYNEPSHFSADFRRRFGILPGEYRLRG